MKSKFNPKREALAEQRRIDDAIRSAYRQARTDGYGHDEACDIANGKYRAEAPKKPAAGTVGDAGKIAAPPNLGELHPYDAVEIPASLDAFKALTWPQRKSLASKISETPIKAIADAEAAFVAELERRAK